MRLTLAVIAVSLLAIGCGKLGVSQPSKGGGSASSTSVSTAEAVRPTPKVRFTNPVRGSFLAAGRAAVEGETLRITTASADAIVSATVNGAPVTLDAAGRFRAFVDLTPGLNMIDAVCTDQRGRNGSTVIGVMAGDYKPADRTVSRAAVARINDGSLDAIGKIAESALWTTDWTAVFQGLNPIYDTNLLWIQVWVNIDQARFRDLHATMDAKPSGLAATVVLDAPVFDVTVAVDLGFGVMIGPYSGVAQADSARVTATLGASPTQQGEIKTSCVSPVTTFDNFVLTVSNGTVDAAIQLFAKNAIQNALKNWVNGALVDDLVPFLDRKIAEFLQRQTPWDILGKPFQIDVRAETFAFDDQGVSIALGFNAMGNVGASARPAPNAPGSLTTVGGAPAAATTRGFMVSLDDDAANRALYALWAGGHMDVVLDDAFLIAHNVSLPIQLEAGSLRRFLPEIAGHVPDTAPVRLHVHANLPPVIKVIGTPDLALAQAGEVVLDIYVDRGQGFEMLLSAVAEVEVGANVGLTQQGLQVSSLSQPRFRFDLVEEPMLELDDRRLEVLLSVVLTPLVPHFMNSSNVLWIPHLSQCQTVNVDSYSDGTEHEHLTVTGDLLR